MSRIVLNTLGSFGDLHPYLALALGLRDRGHQPVIATSEVYRAKIEGEGIEFAPVRPDVGQLSNDKHFLQKLWDPRKGTEFLLRDYLIPFLEQSYQDLLTISDRADLIVSHSITYAAPIVAELRQIPWISIALQPTVFLSACDPPVLAPAPWFRHLRVLGHKPFSWLLQRVKRSFQSWAEPIQQLRLRTGLRRIDANPIFDGQFSPFGTIAFFSPHFAPPQTDWPPNTHCVGFPFYDREQAGKHIAADLYHFLTTGPAPVVFTLGSSAVLHPGRFYEESLEAAQQLGVRAVLLTGIQTWSSNFPSIPDSIHIAPYAPYSELFPHAAAIVHQGGIGTTAQALRAGKPMIIVPWAHDQPDNAERICRLGLGRSISRTRYTAPRIAAQLKRMLDYFQYHTRAAEYGNKIRDEDGVAAACDVVESLLR